MEGDKKPPCLVCDGDEYYIQAGFYYCNECHTQSKGYCENFLDFQDNTLNVLTQSFLDKSLKKPPKVKKERPSATAIDSGFHCTSWEVHNYVLKGLVDELIALGARPELKTVALQLWTKYLSKLEVAFISNTEELLPKFGLNQTPVDYKVIYGQVKERARRLKKMLSKKKSRKLLLEEKLSKSISNANVTAKQMYYLSKQLCVVSEYEAIMAELTSAQDILIQIDEKLKEMADAQEAAKKKLPPPPPPDTVGVKESIVPIPNVQFNKKAKQIMKKLEEITRKKLNVGAEEQETELEAKIKYDNVHSNEKKNMLYQGCHDSMHLTRQKVLALLALALFLSKDDIQISDLLRWITEGHVSYSNVTHLFPEEVTLGASEIAIYRERTPVGYKSLECCVFSIANLLGVEPLLTPDLAGLARRYARELELPPGLADHAEALMSESQVNTYKGLLSHEAIAMAYLIVVLKTLLGLDGQTEHRISAVATKINRLIDHDQGRQLETKLFVWDNWVRYIVCRKSIIMNAHFQTRFKCQNDLSVPANSYVDWWYMQKDKDPNLLERKCNQTTDSVQYKETLAENLAFANALPDINLKDHLYKLPPTLTPHMSYLQEIRAQWCLDDNTRCSVEPTDELTYMHSLTSVDYLIQPDRIIEFASSKGVKVVVEQSRVNQVTEVVLPELKGTLRMQNNARPQITVAFEPALHLARNRKLTRAQVEYSYAQQQQLLEECINSSGTSANESDQDDSLPSKKIKLNHSTNSPDSRPTCKFKDNVSPSVSTSSLILYAPYSNYWVYDLNPKQPEGHFETCIEPDLPDSFCWLLTECSKLLEMRTVDLYTQVRLVEKLCFNKIDLASLKLSVQRQTISKISKECEEN